MNCIEGYSKRIVVVTTGTHGDVIPYLALSKGLQAAGHRVKLIASNEFTDLAAEHQIEFVSIGVDSTDFFKSTAGKEVIGGNAFRIMRAMKHFFIPAVEKMLQSVWQETQDADLIIYNYSVLSGSHIMEKLQIPGIACSYLPVLSPTGNFPLFGLPDWGKTLNKISYSLNRLSSLPYNKVIQRWRKQHLGLPVRPRLADDLVLNNERIPVMYNSSPNVLDMVADKKNKIKATGYWFLDEVSGHDEPNVDPEAQICAELKAFLQAGPEPVYITFGSMVHKNPRQLTKTVVDALQKTGNRGILGIANGGLADIDLPDTVLSVSNVPYDWLFQRVKAVVHHGGYGTTMSVLRSAKPSLICPFFQDQPFWGNLIYRSGLGGEPIPYKQLTVDKLAAAIELICADQKMQAKLLELREKIKHEQGVATAVQFVQGVLDDYYKAKQLGSVLPSVKIKKLVSSC